MTRKYKINRTTLDLDTETGALTGLYDEAGGALIDGGGSLVEAAVPLKYDLETLRTAPCFKYERCAPDVTFEDEILTIRWQRMALNCDMTRIPLEYKRGVEAVVTVSPASDGESLIWSCRIVNHSDTPVRQILFPSFSGIIPVAGDDDTRFTTMGFNTRPFKELRNTTRTREGFYASLAANTGVFYRAGGYFDKMGMIGRWWDIGDLGRGMSVYRRHWGWGPESMSAMGANEQVWVVMDSIADRLRISDVHDVTVGEGESFESGEYVMTPHAGGWARGILPYKAYVNEHKNRCVELPERIAKTLGMRTIWTCEQYEKDPDSIIYKYDDYPAIAEDMLEHGLCELSVWHSSLPKLPVTAENFPSELGGLEGWKRNAVKLREMGVEVSPLVSWLSIWSMNCERYGYPLPSVADAGWGENLKGVPMFRPSYMQRYCCQFLSDQKTQPLWLEDVRESLRFWRDEALTPSICWDQYLVSPGDNIYPIIDEYRRETKKKYPDASFSGESTFYYEADIDQLDYTWDWMYWPGIGDVRPYMDVVRTTRPNMNIDSEPLYVKYSFMDNYFINAYPSKPNNINGSAMIRDYPEFSRALKQCAAMREYYLDFFLHGSLIAECVLSRECGGARVTGYILENRALIFAVKNDDGEAQLDYDLALWCGKGRYGITVKDADMNTFYRGEGTERGGVQLSGAQGELFAVEITKS